MNATPEEVRREHENGYCWCGAYHGGILNNRPRSIDLRALEAELLYWTASQSRANDIQAVFTSLRDLRAKAQAYLDSNAPTAAANLRSELAKVKDGEPVYDNRVDLVYQALGQIKGINATCEQHRNYPWQLHCETCRRFVAEELVGLGARIETAR